MKNQDSLNIFSNALYYKTFLDIYKSRGSSPWDPASKVQKQSNPPIPGLKLSNKVNKSLLMPAYVPGEQDE